MLNMAFDEVTVTELDGAVDREIELVIGSLLEAVTEAKLEAVATSEVEGPSESELEAMLGMALNGYELEIDSELEPTVD